MINIAIIEDDKDLRDLLVNWINKSNTVHCEYVFEDAESAIKEIVNLDLDVILVDIGLPNQSGIECIRALKTQEVEAQFLIYTSFNDTDLIFEALKAGASGYITKTTEPSKLMEAIIDIHNGGSPMSSEIARKVVSSFQQKEIKINQEIEKLSEREKEILNRLSEGLRYKEIADNLFLSTETIRTHIRNIYRKLQVNSRTEAINKTSAR